MAKFDQWRQEKSKVRACASQAKKKRKKIRKGKIKNKRN